MDLGVLAALKVKIAYYDREGRELAVAWLYLTCVEVSLDVDWSRSGRVKSKGKDKAKWTWGPDGQGAVLLVNCDRDSPGAGGTDSGEVDIRTLADLQDMSVMLLRTQGPSAIFAEYPVVLHVPESDADKARVFHAAHLLPSHRGDSTFYVEGLAFPDRGFTGLVSFSASLLEVPHKDAPGTPIFTDTVVFRVAPWIMTPNTQQPLEVFVCRTVRGKEYPLGRILIGSPLPWAAGRRMCRAVRDFLLAQSVQAPLEVYSEWLSVGHVDEFLTFVPALDRKGFRLLLASPNACYKLFKEKQQQGHGEATQFIGPKAADKKSIDEILADESLRSDNRHVQRCIDWNRDLLKQELGLSEQDIVDIPQLFILTNSRADALFPDMVNMLVLGRHLGIPKPFGPVVGGRCCLEQRVRELLEPLGLSCTFIDDFFSYHVLSGDVHCGTNVRRKPFAFKWWNVVP
nr:protein-arginine deiminase type-1 [Lonchura striata domestica]